MDEETRNDGKLEDGMKTTKQSTARHGTARRGEEMTQPTHSGTKTKVQQSSGDQSRRDQEATGTARAW